MKKNYKLNGHKVPIFHLKRVDFPRNLGLIPSVSQLPLKINPSGVKYCPTLLDVEFIVMTSYLHFLL